MEGSEFSDDRRPGEPNSLPPTRLDGGPQALPPTRLDQPPTQLDGIVGKDDADEGETYLRLPPALRADYEILRELAAGGEGDLLLTRHGPTGEQRVVKIYRVDRRRDQRAIEVLAEADPEHVVKIYEFGEYGGRSWEVMEYCELGSLADLFVREGPKLSLDRIEDVIEEVAAALAHLHGLRIPHRDLKPGNILIRTSEPELDLVLADFGLAHVIDLSKEMHSRLLLSAAYAAPQASAGAISPAMDWWSLGIIVAEMAIGRNPFQLENGMRMDDQLIADRISSRPLDFDAIEDPRLVALCRGLTLLDDRRGHRWGAEQVFEWLDGGNPPIAAAAETDAPLRAAAAPVPFKDPDPGRTRPFTDPIELAAAFAADWEGACNLLGGSAAFRAEQRALRSFLHSLGLTDAEQILTEQDDVEVRLVRLLVELDPEVTPTFRGYVIDREGLLALARSESEGSRAALEAIFAERILLDCSRSAGYPDLADLDAAWHEELAAFEQTLAEVRTDGGKPVLADQKERQAARAAACVQIIEALLDPAAHRRVLERGAEAAADPGARREGWFATLADEVTGG
ncbi:MAG: hypothetical protein BGO11_07490 [Solirubrobacterales bacterium 70-9]|nr:MAG: hypothetical protein BGO11_07490 [Solirubrobacterales bacterium 70-9]